MSQSDSDFSTQKITPELITRIVESIKNKAYGSVEIYIENYSVTQITNRTITKIKPAPKNNTRSTNFENQGTRVNRFQLKIQKF